MHHLLYTEDHIALQDSLKKFCEAEINPLLVRPAGAGVVAVDGLVVT